MKQTQLAQLLDGKPYQAIVVTSEINRRYVTGFPSSAGVVYLSARQAVFYTDFRYVEAAKAALTSAHSDTTHRDTTAPHTDAPDITPDDIAFTVRCISAGTSYASVVRDLLAADQVTCVALEDQTLTHAAFVTWTKSLAVQTAELGNTFEQMRQVKTPAEIEHVVAAQRIAERAYTELQNDIRVGVTEKELAARLIYLLFHYGAENLSFDPIVVSGANSSKPHGVPTEKPLADGDFVTMDFGCIADGYCSDMTRTVAVGHATDEMCRVYATVLAAQEAGIAACHAGVSGRVVDAAGRAVITEASYGDAFGHGFGHGVGLEIHELPVVSQRADSLLPVGAIVTAEPGIYLPGRFGVRIEDMLAVRADGCTNLTQAPKDLLIL